MTLPTLSPAFIGNFGGGEIILIFLIVLLLFGAKKVPELFRSLGKGVKEFKNAKSEWEQDINDVMNQEPLEDHDFKKGDSGVKNSVPTDSESKDQEKQTSS
jgi:TatA/E family protein of Tat protein translocase